MSFLIVYIYVCVGCGFVCFYLSFSLFSSLSEDKNSHQLCSISDACGDWMMTGGSGYRSGGSVQK